MKIKGKYKEKKESIYSLIEELSEHTNNSSYAMDIEEVVESVNKCDEFSTLDSLEAGLTWVIAMFHDSL